MRRIAVVVTILLAALAGCSQADSSGGDGQPRDISDKQLAKEVASYGADWSAAGGADALAVAAKVGAAGQGCADLVAFPKPPFIVTFVKLGWPIPRYAGRCTIGAGEDLQIEVYKDRATLARRIRSRAARLCQQERFPGYAYVEGDSFLLTPDERATARALAPVVGGTARFQNCAR